LSANLAQTGIILATYLILMIQSCLLREIAESRLGSTTNQKGNQANQGGLMAPHHNESRRSEMGYYGYKATQSDGAMDTIAGVATLLAEKWNEVANKFDTPFGTTTDHSGYPKGHGVRMGIIHMLLNVPEIDDSNDYGLRKNAIGYLVQRADELANRHDLVQELEIRKEWSYTSGLLEKLTNQPKR
jgi:hypothetical protein